MKNTKTYIIAIGAITNIAMAIIKEPKIVDKIEIVWLGGHSLSNNDNIEFNFRQDIDAVRTVAMPIYKVCILCHIFLTSRRLTKVGKFALKNYI